MACVYRLMVLVSFVVLAANGALTTQHVVGGSQGWGESTDFSAWTSGRTFKVGDQLVFKYTAGLHTVVELADENAYKSCDTSSAVDSMDGGNSVVKLSKPGTRYFACGTPGHCDQGMKVKIKTVADNGSSPSDSSATSSTTSTSPASTFQSPPIGVVMSMVLVLLNYLV
ncbi:PREDICTED: mavicyanin [Nelumbo nucifera]|uniref:Mavicyanin n=1 Tax=Nelumbo nucifera TaxID=4432 RepID=A0A1U7ZM19_NELNU|nr:PREDICTED: mavicyanin [Nelumbo nucifera]